MRSRAESLRVYGPPEFREWGYRLPCLVVGCRTWDYRPGHSKVMEQCHTRTGGTGRKSDWTDTVFMCWRHHDESGRGVRTFESVNELRVVAEFEEIDVASLVEAAAWHRPRSAWRSKRRVPRS